MQDEHEFVCKNMKRIRLKLNNNMTILDFVKSKQTSTLEELSGMIKECPDNELPTKEELVAMYIELASDASQIYNKGVNDTLELISKCDSTFLKRKCPPHVLS